MPWLKPKRCGESSYAKLFHDVYDFPHASLMVLLLVAHHNHSHLSSDNTI